MATAGACPAGPGAVHWEGVIVMPYADDGGRRFKPGAAENAELTKKKVADAGQKAEVEQHAATVAKQREAESIESAERERN